MADTWPRHGSCGACARPAQLFPSGNWEHLGVPCRARSQAVWEVDDAHIRLAVVFVAEGEPLPSEPEKGHWHTVKRLPDGFPAALGWCDVDHRVSIREFLAAEAESRELTNASGAGEVADTKTDLPRAVSRNGAEGPTVLGHCSTCGRILVSRKPYSRLRPKWVALGYVCHQAKGLCCGCYRRQQRHGSTAPGGDG